MSMSKKATIDAFEYRAEQSEKAKRVLANLVKKCSKCNVPASKRRLYRAGDDGWLCSSCVPEGTTVQDLEAQEKAYQDYMEAEANKPKPESFGAFS